MINQQYTKAPSHYERAASAYDTVFVLHNTGETNDLIPVINQYIKTNCNSRVLAIGIAAELVKGKLPPENIVTLSDLGIATTLDKHEPRTKLLTHEEIEKIVDLLPAKQLVSGVPAMVEDQILRAYRQRNVKTFAYWDNFSASGPDIYFSTALKVQESAQYVLFPSQSVVDSPAFSYRPASQKIVVGKPSMKEWVRTFKAIDLTKVREEAGIPQKAFVATWIGGYGADHKKAFELFVRCIKNLRPEERPDKVIIQQHPSANKQELDPFTYFDKEDPMILPEERKLSTVQASAISDVVISYNSTAGVQALLAGKKVFFVVPEGDVYSNIAIDRGIVPKVNDCAAFALALRASPAAEGVWEQLGIPQETVESEQSGTDSVGRFMKVLQPEEFSVQRETLWDKLRGLFCCISE